MSGHVTFPLYREMRGDVVFGMSISRITFTIIDCLLAGYFLTFYSALIWRFGT